MVYKNTNILNKTDMRFKLSAKFVQNDTFHAF